MKFEKEYREAWPETIGEKDTQFDMLNYSGYLENCISGMRFVKQSSRNYISGQQFESETGKKYQVEIEDRHYPGRYDTYYTDSYVEWLKANVEKLTSTNTERKELVEG